MLAGGVKHHFLHCKAVIVGDSRADSPFIYVVVCVHTYNKPVALAVPCFHLFYQILLQTITWACGIVFP